MVSADILDKNVELQTVKEIWIFTYKDFPAISETSL